MYNCTKINQQTMKKILLAVIVSLSIIVIPSCKKGEDDPFISIRSRDARITAKWKLVNLESTSSGPSSTTTSVLNGSLLTVTYTSPSYGSSSSTSSYSLDLEINSDGTSSSTEILDGDISTSKSTWNWKNDNNDKFSFKDNFSGNDRASQKALKTQNDKTDLNSASGTNASMIHQM